MLWIRFQQIKIWIRSQSQFEFEDTVSVVCAMEMSVHSRNFPLYSKSDEQYSTDDRNNNVKNGQNSNKSIKKSTELVEENNHQIDSQLWGRTDDELKFKWKNSEKYKMENYLHEIRSNDSQSNDSIDTTKNSAAINFSVDSILNSANVTQTYNKETSKLTDTSIADDFNRIHRPMPMRYVSSSNIFQGNHKNLFEIRPKTK